MGERFFSSRKSFRSTMGMRPTRDEEIEPLPIRSRELWRLTGQPQADRAHLSFMHNDLQRLNAVRDQEPGKHGKPDKHEEQVETCKSCAHSKALE